MPQVFDISECKVRLAVEQDTKDLHAIARSIWGGSDYLPKVLNRWLNEPYFFVCEYRGRVIGCIKLSLFPNHVLWFEGLRVLGRYQGKGIGTLLNREMFKFAHELKSKDPLLSFEFCTYYQNVESLHLTQKLGFKVVKGFYALDKCGIKAQAEPKIISSYNTSIFSLFPDYIPCAWQTFRNSQEAIEFIKDRAVVFETPQARYLLGGLHEKYITILSAPPKDIKAELPYFQFFFAPRKRYGLILPTSLKHHLKRYKAVGFRFWDKEARPVENMLVLRKD